MRIVPLCRLHLLIDAFAQIEKNFPNTKLVIAGDTKQDPVYVMGLRQKVESYNLQNRIVWTGFLNEIEKEGAFAAATIFSHVSQSEGMALAVLEAMHAELPVIVSPQCNMDTAVEKQAVMQVEYDVESLSHALSVLLNDEKRRVQLGNTAHQHAQSDHNWSKIAKQIGSIYKRAL